MNFLEDEKFVMNFLEDEKFEKYLIVFKENILDTCLDIYSNTIKELDGYTILKIKPKLLKKEKILIDEYFNSYKTGEIDTSIEQELFRCITIEIRNLKIQKIRKQI